MIQKLKRRFILLSMSALLVLLAVLVTGMNLMNYNSVVKDADAVLEVLSQNKGQFPDFAPNLTGRPGDKLLPQFSPETPYESRYFSVSYDEAGNVVSIDVSRIYAVDREDALYLADQTKGSRGFAGDYRYMATRELTGRRIIFLDCGRRLDAFEGFLLSSIFMSVVGYAVVFVVIFILSGKIIKPIAESYDKQKRFITDAGHEIKTPLTIINANADILEMELSQPNDSIRDIKEQTKRLKSLTEDLVMLSRMEETEQSLAKIPFPVSEVVEETVSPFGNLAKKENKCLCSHIEPMLTLNGNEKAIRQLVSILLENACKYSEEGGSITLTLVKQNRWIILTVSNTVSQSISPEQLKNVFERFYRMDGSRNSETGGHGIGLSIARAIVTAHDGKIKATADDGQSFVVTASFPI